MCVCVCMCAVDSRMYSYRFAGVTDEFTNTNTVNIPEK